MCRAEGQFTAEHVIRNSFHQFQYEKALPDIGRKIEKLEEEAATLDASGEVDVADYHKLRLDLAVLEKKMMAEIRRPERVLYYLQPRGLVKIREGSTDWGWGVVVNVVKKPPASSLPAVAASRGGGYIVGTLLHCSPGSSDNGSKPRPCPPRPGENGSCSHDSHICSMQTEAFKSPVEARQSILIVLQELDNRFPEVLPKLNTVQLQKFRDELTNRSRVLKKLGHIDSEGVLQSKGRAAAQIDTGDELLVTELMFDGTFNDLDHRQVAAPASCFIPGGKSDEQINLRTELAKPLQQFQDNARKIAEIQHECKLEVNVEEFVESTVRPYLIDIIYCWSKGANFSGVIQMTDIFEGSVIRLVRRLDEFLNQVQ